MRGINAERTGLLQWDVDSTLLNIQPIFSASIALACSVLCENLEEQTTFSTRFYQLQSQVMKVHHVDPSKIWTGTLERLKQEYIFNQRQHDRALEIFMSIYTTAPVVFPGIVEALSTLDAAGYDQVYVTHAREDWTDFKMQSTGIDDFFQGRVIVDVTGPKTHKDWGKAKQQMQVKEGEEVWVIGDNIVADLFAAKEAGINNLIWAGYSVWGNVVTVNLPEGNVHTALRPQDIPRIILDR